MSASNLHDPSNVAASSPSLLAQIRVHRGAIDRTTITTAPPAQAMHTMRTALLRMGVRVRDESAFRIRCVRPGAGDNVGEWDDSWDDADERKEEEEDFNSSSSSSGSESDSGSGSGSDTETEATKRAPKRALAPKRVQVHRIPQTAETTGSTPSITESVQSTTKTLKSKPSQSLQRCTLYGPSPASDPSHEVRFSVELTQLAGLPGTYSLDIRRLKGHLRSYKFIYDTLRDHAAELNRLGPIGQPSTSTPEHIFTASQEPAVVAISS